MTKIGITGMGAVSAGGVGVEALWQAARDGISAVSPLSIPRGENLRVRIAASVRDFDPSEYLSESEIRSCDRFAQFAHVAVAEALQQAKLTDEQLKGPRTAVIIGTGIGGMTTLDNGCYEVYSGKSGSTP
jgi:nodulation protein E